MTFKLVLLCVVGLAMVAGGAKAADNPVVAVETSMGTFKVELYEDKAPVTVKNFLTYVDEKFYDGTIFHRVIGKENKGDDFMIQGGGFTQDKKEKDNKAPIKNEAANGVKNEKYTIAMARTGVVDSATSQFFINVKDNDFLNHKDTSTRGFGYCAFGKVIEGTEVVDKIKAVKTADQGGAFTDAPVEPVVIKSIRRVAK